MRGEEDHICKLNSARSDCLEDFLAAENNKNIISFYIEEEFYNQQKKVTHKLYFYLSLLKKWMLDIVKNRQKLH